MADRPHRIPVPASSAAWWLTAAVSLLALCGSSSPGAAARVQVEITGVEGPVKKNVELLLGIVAAQKEKEELSASAIRRLHEGAPGEIELALQPFGYYAPVTTAALDEEPEKPGRWLARYEIDVGEPVIVRSIDFEVSGEGSGTPPFDAV